MLEKYEFILALKLLEFEIRQMTKYTNVFPSCFALLKNKLDFLCEFINDDENVQKWQSWNQLDEVQEHARNLRETAVQALCELEKYQSRLIHKHEKQISHYIDQLSNSVQAELASLQVDHQSKVLFVGSGAFPLSALTIAQETGAEVLGVDIDKEAVLLAEQAAAMSDFGSKIGFSHQKLKQLAFTKEATHIIVASLVENKLEVLEELKHAANSRSKIMMRYGSGLKSLFNYPLPQDKELSEWTQSHVHTSSQLYDTIILERAMQMKGV
ncbi:nicotianamine synthase family protein [Paenibacillus planticolens]|uniref:Uncharacterized protein n=1 Tax=Paenibacillus planticolens TaxID=2654976 RepID=A0ABX1ZTK7_9BACL|nr:nicotianamine synthase family protein [Paenibacillus planticolens]NOV02179.1 hypothetical protein [Paenibacillus planticolens]